MGKWLVCLLVFLVADPCLADVGAATAFHDQAVLKLEQVIGHKFLEVAHQFTDHGDTLHNVMNKIPLLRLVESRVPSLPSHQEQSNHGTDEQVLLSESPPQFTVFWVLRWCLTILFAVVLVQFVIFLWIHNTKDSWRRISLSRHPELVTIFPSLADSDVMEGMDGTNTKRLGEGVMNRKQFEKVLTEEHGLSSTQAHHLFNHFSESAPVKHLKSHLLDRYPTRYAAVEELFRDLGTDAASPADPVTILPRPPSAVDDGAGQTDGPKIASHDVNERPPMLAEMTGSSGRAIRSDTMKLAHEALGIGQTAVAESLISRQYVVVIPCFDPEVGEPGLRGYVASESDRWAERVQVQFEDSKPPKWVSRECLKDTDPPPSNVVNSMESENPMLKRRLLDALSA